MPCASSPRGKVARSATDEGYYLGEFASAERAIRSLASAAVTLIRPSGTSPWEKDAPALCA